MLLTQSDEEFNRKYNFVSTQIVKNTSDNVADEIEKLHKLKESGAITAAEYEAKKGKLLQ